MAKETFWLTKCENCNSDQQFCFENTKNKTRFHSIKCSICNHRFKPIKVIKLPK